LCRVIAVGLRGVDLQHNIVAGDHGFRHVLRGEPFRGGLIVSHRNLVRARPLWRRKNLFDNIRLQRTSPERSVATIYFLNHAGRLWITFTSAIFWPVRSSTLVRLIPRLKCVLGKILCTKQWRCKKRRNKAKESKCAHIFIFMPSTNSYPKNS